MAEHSCSWRRTAEEQAEQLRAKEAELAGQAEELARLASKVKELEHQLALATKQIIGPKSERMPTPEEEAKKREEPTPCAVATPTRTKRKENAEANAALPTDDVPHPVADEDRRCPHCGEEAKPIGDGRALRRVRMDPRAVREAIARRRGRRGARASSTTCAVPRRCACRRDVSSGPGLLAKLVVDKCADATPIYRIEKAMRREGIPWRARR